jgi:hypothetical protein
MVWVRMQDFAMTYSVLEQRTPAQCVGKRRNVLFATVTLEQYGLYQVQYMCNNTVHT